MARADLLIALVRAALRSDQEEARAVAEAIAAEERRKQHTVLAGQLTDELARSRTAMSGRSVSPLAAPHEANAAQGLRYVEPRRRLDDLFLAPPVRQELELLLEEQQRFELLRAYGMEPRHTVLLVGPSGNGKTSCAEAIATELALPLLVLQYENIITSYLGETAARLQAAIDDARRQHCVLLLDEFDVLGKERGDDHETGEVKRVVSSLLLQLDRLPSHVVLVAATNHAGLLDSAVWRRFELQLNLSAPGQRERRMFGSACSARLGLELPQTTLQRLLRGLGSVSYADLETALMDLRRREILAGPAWDKAMMEQAISAAIANWRSRGSSSSHQADETEARIVDS